MPTKKALDAARAEYATSLRELAGAALAVVEKGPTIWDDRLEVALDGAKRCKRVFLAAHNADRAADLIKLPRAE